MHIVADNHRNGSLNLLCKIRKKMNDALEATNIAYEARDQAEREAASLMAQADHEQSLFDAEMKEIAKLIEADQHCYDTNHRMNLCHESAGNTLRYQVL